MIESVLYAHLVQQTDLASFLATYGNAPAVFNQEAPSDTDEGWGSGSQYGRLVFLVDIQGDPARTMGGRLSVDILCKEGEQVPEEMEPLVRGAIHGYFFSSGTFTVAAQWSGSSYFTEPTEQVIGCTVKFDLLGFPVLTTADTDVVARVNAWTAQMAGVHVINYDQLPSAAWKPETDTAVYWRVVSDRDAGWVKNTFATVWRTATLRCHIFSPNNAAAAEVARNIIFKLYQEKRLKQDGESQIMVNRKNTVDDGADPLRVGQVTVEGTYGVMVYRAPQETLNHISVGERSVPDAEQI